MVIPTGRCKHFISISITFTFNYKTTQSGEYTDHAALSVLWEDVT